MRIATVVLAAAFCGAVVSTAPAGDAPAEPAGEAWSTHRGDVPFVIGYDAGMKEVEFTGKPPMFFFTMEG